MMPETDTAAPDPDITRRAIRRRRAVLYAAAALALVVIAVVAVRGLSPDEPKVRTPVRMAPPVIVERIRLKAVDGSKAHGLVEVLRRGQNNSLRILATGLKPNRRTDVHQLVLRGGSAPEQLLGSQNVGQQGVFVGEARISLNELRRHRRIELRLVRGGTPPREKTVLRGRIPR